MKPILDALHNNSSSYEMTRRTALLGSATVVIAAYAQSPISTTANAAALSLDEARAIAKEATIYGFPLVDS